MDRAVEHIGNGSGHEHREASVRLVVLSAAGLVVMVIVILLLIWGAFNLLKVNRENVNRATQVTPLAPLEQVPPSPRVEEHPNLEYPQERAYEDNILSTYGWQDKQKGIVHIPVDRAMDILAQRGIPGGHVPPKTAPKGSNNVAVQQ